MLPRRFNYASDCDKEILSPEEKYYASFVSSNRLAFTVLPIPPSVLSTDGTEWLHAVEATKKDKKICIRVITNTYRGINVWIPITSETLYLKYHDLRFQIRNSDKILVTFPELFIRSSGYKNELLLIANDFKVFDPNEEAQKPIILI